MNNIEQLDYLITQYSTFLQEMYIFLKKQFDQCMSILFKKDNYFEKFQEFHNLVIAMICKAKGELKECLEHLKQCYNLNKDNKLIIQYLSMTFYLMGKFQQSMEISDIGTQNDEDNWKQQLIKSKLLFANKQYDDSIYNLDKILLVFQNDLILVMDIQLKMKQGKLYHIIKKQKNVIIRIMNIAKSQVQYSNLGQLYLKMNDPIQAFQYFAQSLAIDYKNQDSLIGLASILQNKQQFDNALIKYRISVYHNQNNSNVWNNIGMSYYGKKNYLTAITCLKKALYLDPFQYKINFNLGLAYYQNQQFASAFHQFFTANQLQENDIASLIQMALCLCNLNDQSNAKVCIDKAIQNIDKNQKIIDFQQLIDLYNIVYLFLRNDNLDQAQQFYLILKSQFEQNKQQFKNEIQFETISNQLDILIQIFE